MYAKLVNFNISLQSYLLLHRCNSVEYVCVAGPLCLGPACACAAPPRTCRLTGLTLSAGAARAQCTSSAPPCQDPAGSEHKGQGPSSWTSKANQGGGATKWSVMWGAGSSGPASEARHAGADQAVFLAAAVQRVRSVCVLSFCSCYWPKRSWGEEQSCLLVNITIYTWIYGCSNTGGLNVLDISQKDRETHDKKFFHNRNQELIGYILQYFVTIDET